MKPNQTRDATTLRVHVHLGAKQNSYQWWLVLVVLLLLSESALAQNDMSTFITRSGDKLMEGDKQYRFISVNIPNLHLIEDNMAFAATNEWRFPDEFEITDALTSVKQLGGRAVRTYVLSICRKNGPNPIPCHVTRPGEFNEEAFRALDKVLQVANRVGVRLIIPLVDNWKWWGGIDQYAEYHGKAGADFWTDAEIIGDFKKTVSYTLNRRNTFTGTLYKDDKAILAWETGNEINCPYSWTREIAAYLKSIDKSHLVWDGFYIGNREIQPEALRDPNVDVVSSHHYPAPKKGGDEMAADIVRFHQQTGGKKVYVVGELGFIPVAGVEKVLDTVIRTGVSGAMIWSLRYHNRDGGFYWHSEPAGAGVFKAYHYPGFASGEAYEERKLLQLLREKAFEISGLPTVQPAVPAAPTLLPIKTAAEISWQGSAGANGYDVERAPAASGPWEIVGHDVDDTVVQYRSLFSDDSAAADHDYYYRVLAKNTAGPSPASNVVGPVRFVASWMVDELNDFSRSNSHGGALTFENVGARPYKEDTSRLRGSDGSWITYRTPGPLRSARILAFMEGTQVNFEFYGSRDGHSFTRVESRVSPLPTAVNAYGYKLPVQYELDDQIAGQYFIKILFKSAAQISRVELAYDK
jgi:mannan endo-1,4-beta-mannosidase